MDEPPAAGERRAFQIWDWRSAVSFRRSCRPSAVSGRGSMFNGQRSTFGALERWARVPAVPSMAARRRGPCRSPHRERADFAGISRAHHPDFIASLHPRGA